MSSRRRRISISSIIGPRIAYYNHWLLKGTSTSPSLFVLFRSLSNTTKNPTSPPQGREPKPKALPKQPCNLGPNHLHSALISFNRMLRMRPLPTISQFNKALGSILKMGHYATALSLIQNKLQRFQGIQVNFYTFNIAINCYCHLNRADFGLSLLGTLFKRGYTADVTTFTTLINGLILQDKTPQAVELFKKLVRTREIEPDVVMYGTIVNALCRTGNTIRAVSLLRIMEEGSCKPNTVVYTTIIDSLCKDRMAFIEMLSLIPP
ncbi:putative pentatricopeptide repeat-containing protein At1g12700, mitochondrial [Camellia sinensis]|uniref:putative pentatricopeptide repeat-containing protein At1g12700, mitochondrial n=1 Tax=Camellia sinensis TaxID=4442 RepID=UPI0010367FB7|nr:putative pentatricopeptide repeat-containing protein At1g12700, mitochondrial [Camellia sinensis]